MSSSGIRTPSRRKKQSQAKALLVDALASLVVVAVPTAVVFVIAQQGYIPGPVAVAITGFFLGIAVAYWTNLVAGLRVHTLTH